MAKVVALVCCVLIVVGLLVCAVGVPGQGSISFKVGRLWVGLDNWNARPHFAHGRSRDGSPYGEFVRLMWVDDAR